MFSLNFLKNGVLAFLIMKTSKRKMWKHMLVALPWVAL